MKKTTALLTVFVVLILMIGFFLWKNSAKEDAAKNYEGNFKIETAGEIGKIVLSHRAGNTYTLTRSRDGWVMNGKEPVRMSSMTPLLEAMTRVEIRFIPGNKAVPNVMENIEGTYIHVEVYDTHDKLLKAYRVGGVTPDERGTYMVMDGSKQPFVVNLPGWDGAVRTRYALEFTDWRDRHFMKFAADDVTDVSVEYPNQKSQSFRIAREGQGYTLSPLFPGLREYSKDYRKGTAESFLQALAGAACEGYENQYPLKDSIRQIIPFCAMEIRLKDVDAPVQVKIWPKGIPVPVQGGPPVHRLFVEVTPGDFMVVQYDVIKGMLRGYDYFAGIESPLIL